jgi:chemotaxis protein histidine kinase CheA
MNLPNEPRLNKFHFILIDLVFLGVAGLIAYNAKNPFAPLPFVSAVVLVVLGGIALLIPFLTDYAADCKEAANDERERLAEQTARLGAAAESLTRAAAQIKSVEEAVHKAAHAAENLPYRMQEKLAEFNDALAEKENADREALERELDELRAANSDQLKALAEKIQKISGDWTALETAARKHLQQAADAQSKLNAATTDATDKAVAAVTKAANDVEAHLKSALDELETRLASAPAPTAPPERKRKAPAPAAAETPAAVVEDSLAEPAPASETPEAVAPAQLPPAETPSAVVEDSVAEPAPASEAPAAAEPAIDLSAMVAEPPKPKKPRVKKPKPEALLAEVSATPTEPASAAEPTPAPATSSEEPTPSGDAGGSAPEVSASSDGATRLLATAYIGIGNKLFIRGDGPGLSWDVGVPMQFVSIGKWGWSTGEASGPVRVKLYKNDELAAPLGEITLESGKHTEVTAAF